MTVRLREQILEKVSNALQATGISFVPEVTISNDSRFGEYSTNAAMIAAGQMHKSPMETAEVIAAHIDKGHSIDKVEIVKPGFINFFLSKKALGTQLVQVLCNEESTERTVKNKKKVMVEFTDPNPFKEFHIGHLYSNIVGESISRLLESQGIEVKRACYQGDVGLHVAKSLWGMMQKLTTNDQGKSYEETLADLQLQSLNDRARFLGAAYALGAKAYSDDDKAKEEIIKLNKAIYQQDPSVIDLYHLGKAWSLEYFELIYKRLGTHFDKYYFESVAGPKGMEFIQANMDKGLFKKSEGAIIFHGEEYGLHTRVFINSQGLPTYEAKDLGLAPTKYADYPYDLSIIITGNEVNEYFKTVLKVLAIINPDLAAKTKHISHGMVRLPSGKMSSRTGDVITGEWLLDEAGRRSLAIIQQATQTRPEERESFINGESRVKPEDQQEIADKVGIGAVKYALLRSAIGRDVVFNFDESISFEGNSGPYLQYTYVRTQSVITKLKIQHRTSPPLGRNSTELTIGDNIGQYINFESYTFQQEEAELLRTISYYKEIVSQAAKEYAPHILCTYLFTLAQQFNSFYQKSPIIKAETEQQQELRLGLVLATARIISEGLGLLGIETPDKM